MDALDFLDHQVWVQVQTSTHSDLIQRNELTYFLPDVSGLVQVLKETLALMEAQVVQEDQDLREAWEKWDYQVCLNPTHL